ncbi:TPA: hypothetical protein ACH3X2_011498 [Trebouxia sp. C0005]
MECCGFACNFDEQSKLSLQGSRQSKALNLKLHGAYVLWSKTCCASTSDTAIPKLQKWDFAPAAAIPKSSGNTLTDTVLKKFSQCSGNHSFPLRLQIVLRVIQCNATQDLTV